ncbi:DUF418 domain-containing protein [uncultured Maricaulis sp.]|uniref:DUF418 domain-containing protein n=1 Tax=uncultured Maricaulis sp. TaxID=174710 RepID=UPI002621E151|nr:DUF418 domain-containing protein [uncultured Maricaulis sp.]
MNAPRTDRLVSIDALRGIAVLGILMMNVQGFAMTPFAYDDPTMQMDLTGANLDVWAMAHTFFAFKFITIFSTLFGAGIILMAGDGDDVGKHYPRMLWLLAIGAVHAYFLWWGDILVHYALLGMIAVKARRMAPLKLVIWGLVLISITALLMVGGGYLGVMFATPESAAQEAEMIAGFQTGMTAAYQAGFVDRLPWNAGFALVGQLFSMIGLGPRTLGLMFIGMALFKSGFLSASWSHARYGILALITLPLGWWLCHESTTVMIAGEFETQAMADGNALTYIGSLTLSFGYASAVMLLSKIGLFSLIIKLFAATGRMAFTNYLSQTLIMSFIFVGAPGLGLFGTVERVDQAKLVLIVWAVQLIWSPIWLHFFRFGPLEWVWRSLTYGKAQPLLKEKPVEAAG